jgi:hypothetical protein
MKILSERGCIKDYIDSLIYSITKSLGWGSAIYTKEEKTTMLLELQALDPETATTEEFLAIRKKTAENCMKYQCMNCEGLFFDGIRFNEFSIGYDSESCDICNKCISLAHEKLKESK